MPYHDILCSWLLRSALVSLTILLIGSGAVLVWRQPVRRVRIIELVLAGCLVAPLLGMIPGYPQLSLAWWHSGAVKQQEAPLPTPVKPMMERAIPEPMPLPALDRAAPPVPDMKTVEAPVHAFQIRAWIVGIYLFGVVVGAGWWLVGIVGLVRILWTSQPVPSPCRDLLTEISGGRGDRVRLLVSRRLSQPFASAWGRAVIVLPENLCGDEQSLRWCLAHEWAHVDGHDFRSWLLAGLVRVLFFYQPLLWWLRRQLRLCQDFVADAQAALQARQVEDYAEFLTARAAGRLNPAVIGLSMGCRKSELYRRVIMLLKNESLESRTPRLWTVSVTVAALVLVTVVAAVSLAPRAVAEEKPATSQATAAKPADEASSSRDQPATKEGSKAESKSAPVYSLVAETNIDQAKAIAEIEKLGGKVTVDEKSPRKPVICVDLSSSKVTDVWLTTLRGLPQLQSLDLFSTKITDAGLEHLKGLTNLQSLDLRATHVTDAGLRQLKGLPSLQSLNLMCRRTVTDAGMEYLEELTNLRSLDLAATKVTDAGLVHLKGLTELQSLSLGGSGVTDAGLVHLKGLTKLQSLSLAGSVFSDAGLIHLKGLTELQSLRLRAIKISDGGPQHLEALTNLRSLNMFESNITDAGLVHLGGLTKLQSLSLKGTQVTDLEYLKGLANLKSLDLAYTGVTDTGLEHLRGLTELQSLDVMGTKVTYAGVKGLKKALPNCIVIH